MSLPFLLPAAKLVASLLGAAAVLAAASFGASPSGASPSGASPAGAPPSGADPRPVAGAPLPTTVDGFAPAADVTVRFACGPSLSVPPADAAGVLHLPAGLLAGTAPGAYRLLVSGPPRVTRGTVSGNVVVTVPRTAVLGVAVSASHHVALDPAVPAPDC